METILNVLAVLLFSISLLIVLTKCLECKNADKKTDKLLNDFLTNEHPGKSFVDLMHNEFLVTLKEVASAKDFPDNKCLSSFIRHSNSNINKAMDDIAETYEQRFR